jgi:nucleoside-diphosphate-sugar epimerase
VDESTSQEREFLTVDDVVAAGRDRAASGAREVVLPGGMGIALIEELEQQVAEEGLSHAVVEEIGDASRNAVGDFMARIDAARDRLRSTITRHDE